MALDDRIRDILQHYTTALQKDADERSAALGRALLAAAEEDRLTAEAEAMSAVAAQVAAVRADAEQRLAAEAARIRTEAEQAAGEQLVPLRQELETLRAEAEELRRDRDRLRDVSEQTSTELALLRERAAAAERAIEEAAGQSQGREWVAHAEERQDQLAELDRLSAAARRIGEGHSLSEVLAALGEAIAPETSRTALLVREGEWLEPIALNGFNGVAAGPVPRAEARDLSRGLPFAPLPADHVGYAVPLAVGGQQVGIVYGDDLGERQPAVPAAWPEALEILARHASLRLEALTAIRMVQALGYDRPEAAAAVATTGSTTEDDRSARRYARLLVSEIKLYNEGAVRLGRQNRDLLDRLRAEIDRARDLYEQRVPAHVPARSTYFDDELLQTLADGDPALLGRA